VATQTAEWTSPPANEDDLMAWFRRMRDRDPVQRDPQGAWHILGYPEAVEVLSNYTDFSNIVTEVPDKSPLKLFGEGNLSWMDPPRHRRLRGLVNHVFTPRYIAEMEPTIRATVARFLNRVRPKDTVAFIDEYVFPVMLTLIAQMIGVPKRERVFFGQWQMVLLSLTDPAEDENGLAMFGALTREMHRCLHEQIQDRRRDPQSDLISRLVSFEVDGNALSDNEIAGLTALLISTGEGGATQTLANAIICLDRHPEVAERLRADSSLLDTAIEEVMRYRSQATRLARLTTNPVTVGNHEIPAGQQVTVWLTSANRDPRKFSNPDTFDIDRWPNPHVALGTGIHFCLGASLARLEVRVALEQFLQATRTFSIDYANSRILDPRLICGAKELSLKVDWRDPQ
jgi:cytochrome P450